MMIEDYDYKYNRDVNTSKTPEKASDTPIGTGRLEDTRKSYSRVDERVERVERSSNNSRGNTGDSAPDGGRERGERRTRETGERDLTPTREGKADARDTTFKYSPMSTEKSRTNEIRQRLNLEKRLREEKISKYNELLDKYKKK